MNELSAHGAIATKAATHNTGIESFTSNHAVNTAFMLLCSSLVMLMTPGLAFFYDGLVEKANHPFPTLKGLNMASPLGSIISPLQGDESLMASLPRVLPWAGIIERLRRKSHSQHGIVEVTQEQ